MTIALSLSDDDAGRLERLRAAGGYGSPEAVVSAGLDLLEAQARENEALRIALTEADADLAAGRSVRFETPEALRDHFAGRAEAVRVARGK